MRDIDNVKFRVELVSFSGALALNSTNRADIAFLKFMRHISINNQQKPSFRLYLIKRRIAICGC